MIEKSKLGFVGTGNMGRALVEGLVGQLPAAQITAADIRPEALEGLSAMGVHTSTRRYRCSPRSRLGRVGAEAASGRSRIEGASRAF